MSTLDPVPSDAPEDLLYNAERIDEAVNSSALTYPDRFGVSRMTLAGAMARISAVNMRGAWATATAYAARDVVTNGGVAYISLDAHTSGATFSGDQAAHWRVYQGVLASELADGSNIALGDALVAVKREETGTVSRTLHFYIKKSRLLMSNFCDPTADTAAQVASALAAATTAALAGGKVLEFDPGAIYVTNAEWAILGSNGIRGGRFWGNGCTIHRNTGAGPVVSMSAGAAAGNRCDDHELIGFLLKGQASATYGLYTKGLMRSRLHNLRVIDVATAGLLMEWGVLNDVANLFVSNNVDTFAVNPTKGIILDQANATATYQSSANTFRNAILEAPISDIGIDIVNASLNVFSGGSSEGIPRGARIAASCMGNAFTNGFDFEANSVYDALVQGKRTQFTDMQSYSQSSSSPAIMVDSGAEETCFKGSTLFRVDVHASSLSTTFFGCALNDGGSNGITGTGPYQAWGCTKINASYVKTSEQDFGSWTPGIQGGTTGGSQAYGGANIGRYTRNGRTVHVQYNCVLTSNSGGTGTAQLTGLPFTSLNTANMIVQSVMAENSGVTFAGSNDRVVVQLNPNAVVAPLAESAGGKSAAALAIGSIAAGTYSGQFSYISDR